MIAEILLILAGHNSSLFKSNSSLDPAFAQLLHPGEQQCIQSLSLIAQRYRKVKLSSDTLSRSPSRYICALCSTLTHILKDEYEALVVETEAKILRRDSELVSAESFVPLASIRAIFAEWDAPLAALSILMDELEAEKHWKPGPLIDLLLARSRTGVQRIGYIFSRLSVTVQRVWRTQLIAYLVHGSLSHDDPLVAKDQILATSSVPSCISSQSRESIEYVGRAISTVKSAKWQAQLPRNLASEHTEMLEAIIPENQHAFDATIARIRTNVSEWLWLNVLTHKDVEDAVTSLKPTSANYFLLRNGEFSLALIREIERLKVSRLNSLSSRSSMIREQDLNLALLRASLGTTAQHDPALVHIRFSLPGGPIRPLLPSLSTGQLSTSTSKHFSNSTDLNFFDAHLLGTPLILKYSVSWPLDLFLHPADLTAYATLFSFLSSLRKTHTRIHYCWSSLSNAQRARRRWTGLGEGGTSEDSEIRKRLLRCGWGVVRDMGWFLDTLLGYVMMDVIDSEYVKLRDLLIKGRHLHRTTDSLGEDNGGTQPTPNRLADNVASGMHMDFTTLRTIHTTYVDRLLTGCLLTSPALTGIIRPILEVCERFVGQVERWGGDVLPALLFEGSLYDGENRVGALVLERWHVVGEINQTFRSLLESFYEQLSASTSQQFLTTTSDSSKSILINASLANYTAHSLSRTAKIIDLGDSRRHVERLLLRLDFNGGLSQPRTNMSKNNADILVEGGLA
ncbi:hypothetical protein AMATHDRAFT_4578 [Amanita thiersii Skay4041]|uniref:Spindle pole body component n=1 Tax=Amanita thiersii Skay4041 TaxID=703135 RepID=A0A2A9NPY1_9AGAR|nr:hypothetical protein AMATHDRAFT_4578 [Amanita thiersii Skay4041]